MKFGIGASVLRKEDPALIRGEGRFTSDLVPRNALHAAMVRSPSAHARFTIENADEIRAMPGVKALFTHADIAHLGVLPCQRPMPNGDGTISPVPANPLLQKDMVRHVGDTVAMIVADSAIQARNAAEALFVDYDDLPVVTDLHAAIAPSAPQLWPELPGNVAVDYEIGDQQAVDDAFAEAAHIAKIDLVNNRVVTNYMEPRSAIGEIDARGRYRLTCGSQGVHLLLPVLAKHIFDEPKENFHILTPDVGGGFGTRFFAYREYALVLFAAKKLGAPVFWMADRSDHFVTDYHGRDHISHAQMAFNAKGKILGLKVDTLANLGAYVSQLGPFVPANGSHMLPGCYRVPAIHARMRGVITNTVPVDAYRGAGRPEAAYVIERFIDKAARDLGIKPEILRRRNFIKPSQMPHTTLTGRTYDTGEFDAHMRQAMDALDWKSFNTRKRQSSKAGKLRGQGLAVYIEACSGGGSETAVVRMDRDGGATVLIGTQASGQGHQTAYAQLAHDQLGINIDKIRVIQGDTDRIKVGSGTGGSRSIPVGGASLHIAAGRLAETLKHRAADRLEAATSDIELIDGQARIAGTDRAIPLADITAAAHEAGDLDQLNESEAWTPPHFTFPNGTHAAEVEIDPDTGHIEILDYVVIDDFGVTMNPTLLLGQIHGGIAQGLGQAILEHTVYDESGQLLTASLQDYGLPRADDFPDIAFETRNVPCTTNALGMKGAGEAGAIGACPAIVNAVVDALHRHNGLTHIDMPMTPERVWRAVHQS